MNGLLRQAGTSPCIHSACCRSVPLELIRGTRVSQEVNSRPLTQTATPKRYRAFISYSQRDKSIARRIHRALEAYRVPKNVDAPVGSDRRLGRFFRDDEEMAASESLGAALEGALEDSENLIVICSPSASQSKWVDAEIRHFNARCGGRVFAVIAEGEPHAADPARECFPLALRVKTDAHGNRTEEPDEPRAPDLQREGLPRVRAQLAAGLLGIPFDALWQRDRRRAFNNRLFTSITVLLVVAVIALAGSGWLSARSESRLQAAHQAVAAARSAAADGRIGEALNRLAPYLVYRNTRDLVEGPLRTLLGWIPDSYSAATSGGVKAARLRDATVLLDPGRGVHDISDIGLALARLIRSRDGRRLVAVGDQRVVVFDAESGQRLAHVDNNEVQWLGHAFEAASGLMVVSGAILGPTNGSVRPYLLSISADGRRAERHAIKAHMFWGSAVGVTANCDALRVAIEERPRTWRIEQRTLAATGLGETRETARFSAQGDSENDGVPSLTAGGPFFPTSDAFMGQADRNPFTASGCPGLGSDNGFVAGSMGSEGAPVLTLDPSLAVESAEHWSVAATTSIETAARDYYLPSCTEANPCPVVGGQPGEIYARDALPITSYDRVGSPPVPRWSRNTIVATLMTAPIYVDHRMFNAGHELVICRQLQGRDVCTRMWAMGEDHFNLPFLRSADGRYLFWPFGGAVFDLETVQPLTASGAIPSTEGEWYDFEVDRVGLTLVYDGRLVSFVPDVTAAAWTRSGDARASPRFGILATSEGEPPLHSLAALGDRQYLAVRRDGVLARLDAVSGQELWRLTSAGLGEIVDVQVNPERRHAVLMGRNAWRVFRLEDGFAVSALLRPPPVLDAPTQALECKLADALGPDGGLLATCATGTFAWQPRSFGGEIAPLLRRLTCATEVEISAIDTIRRCYLEP